ncbi:MAG: 50S ribosomal protein L18 [Desulfurococcaceae archaeon]
MAKGSKYKVPRRRRREGKTNYYKRYVMVVSGHPRFVVRRTNKYLWVQVVTHKPEGDYTIASAHSRELVTKFSWKGGTANTSAAYLTGLLAALRALQKGVKYAVPDIGLHRPVKGSVVFAAIKAANDVGLKVPVSEEIVPSQDRISGRHIAEYARLLKEKNALEARFSKYLERGLDPEQLPKHFEEVKEAIFKAHGFTG